MEHLGITTPAKAAEPGGAAPAEDLRSWLASIVDSSNDPIISKSRDGVISSWNAAAARLFGYSEAEAVGQPITLIIPGHLHDEEKDILRRVRNGERIEHYETRRATRDGRLLDVSLTISPVRDTNGTIVGASTILRDITETRRVLAALRDSERRLAAEVAGVKTLQSISTRLISELTPKALFSQIVEAAMELMASDAASVQMLSADGQSLMLLGCRNFHPESAAFWNRVTVEARSTCGVALRDNQRVLVNDVESCVFMADTQDLEEYRRSRVRAVQSTPLRSRMGTPLGMISTHWRTPHTPTADDLAMFDVLARQAADLIERTRTESALRESEERFRLIANTAPVMIWMWDITKHCTYVNKTWLDLTGQPADAARGTGWATCIHPDDVVRSWDAYVSAFERREPVHLECRLRGRDGDYRSIVGTAVPTYDGDGVFAGYIGSAIDLTERRQAEQVLATMNQRLFDAQDEERSRIARELHDDISQRLVLLNFRLDALSKSVAFEVRQVEDARDEVMTLAEDVQGLSHRLHPSRAEYLGIVKAVEALCREISGQHRVEIHFHHLNAPAGLPPAISGCLYRVLQEALQNAIKHGRAATIVVSLQRDADQIELTVRDLGVGFDTQAVKGFGLGLTSMKERLNSVGGRLTILSTPQAGTTVRARVPLP